MKKLLLLGLLITGSCLAINVQGYLNENLDVLNSEAAEDFLFQLWVEVSEQEQQDIVSFLENIDHPLASKAASGELSRG